MMREREREWERERDRGFYFGKNDVALRGELCVYMIVRV